MTAAAVRQIRSDPVLGTPPLAADLSPSERTFVAYVEPRLTALYAESAEVAAIGESRGRDAVALLEGQRHVETLIAELSVFIEREGVPERFIPSTTIFASAASLASQSMRDARMALTRLEWQALGESVENFGVASEQFRIAAESLTEAAASA